MPLWSDSLLYRQRKASGLKILPLRRLPDHARRKQPIDPIFPDSHHPQLPLHLPQHEAP